MMETEMRNTGLTVGAILVAAGIGLTGLGAGGAFAASGNPQKALAGGLGGTSCGHFMRLSKTGQDRLVRRLVRSAPAGTLATIPPSANGGGAEPRSSNEGTKNNTVVSTAPLRASDLVAACQAATGASTIRSAYEKFALGGSAASSQ
jgi:hypothetical protein